MNNSNCAPYIHTEKNFHERTKDWAIALLPVLIWSVYTFGARVISLCLIGGGFSLGFDYLVQRYIFKSQKGNRIDGMAAIYGILAVFSMPVVVPLFLPVLSSALVVLAKNLRIIRGKRLFNPFIFSTGVLYLAFNSLMTSFTRPFAYFSAFTPVLDSKLVAGYRVISPLQYMADGSVYEDGVWAQLYGFASGNIGEIAIAAMIISLVWLLIRKKASIYATGGVLFPILILALIFPSADAESNYYAYSVLLSGGIGFISVFAMSENYTVPFPKWGKALMGVLCGSLIFLFRRTLGGFEYGYYIVLALNVVSPFIEIITRPRYRKKKKKAVSNVKTQETTIITPETEEPKITEVTETAEIINEE